MIYLWKCLTCDFHVEIDRPMVDCTDPPNSDECTCTDDHNTWQRVYESPSVMRASYPDGTKRKGWDKWRETARLEKEALTKPQNKRAEYTAEIRKLGTKSNLISTGSTGGKK